MDVQGPLDSLETLFVAMAFLLQVVLIIHFAMRRWRFETAMRFGPIVYALSIPAATGSLLILAGGKPWSLWLGGFLYLLWAAFGYTVEYLKHIQWRDPVRWSILGPYLLLYMATVMFFWWPLALLSKPLWYGYAALFVLSTILNVASHGRRDRPS